MKISFLLATGLLACALHQRVWAHGLPIVVDVVAGRLTVSGGVADPIGYADWVFADPDPESWFMPATATQQFTTLPGFDVNGMSTGELISMEVISRPDLSAAGHPDRWLWHWNLAAEEVDEAPADPSLELLSQRGFNPGVSLTQWNAPANTTIKLADLLGSDIGEHRHMLAYFLDDSPAAPAGVYGFFARLVAPGYQSSDPFLVALNLNIFDEVQFQEAALEINVTAGLAGDFDADGDVDGGDVLAWQRELGSTGTYQPADGSLSGVVEAADLAIWKSQFGSFVELPAATAAAAAVPEPGAMALAAWLAALVALRTGCRE